MWARETARMKRLLQGARNFGPYLLLEVLLPGGSVMALLLWLYRHHYKKVHSDSAIEGKATSLAHTPSHS
jgi:hypothetical protein